MIILYYIYILLIYLRVSWSIKKTSCSAYNKGNNKITTEYFFTEQSNIVYITYLFYVAHAIL